MLEADPAPPLALEAAAQTDIGGREHNEDAVLIRPDLGLHIVADGAGGENAGNVASALAITTVARFLEDGATTDGPTFDDLGLPIAARRLSTAIHRANQEIITIAKTSRRYRGMGTTIVVAYAPPGGDVVHIAHVGDSRCYRLRGGYLEQLTHDHSLANDVLEMRPDLPQSRTQRLPRDVITRALGMGESVRVSVQSWALAAGDRFLLCSDGLTDALDDGDIVHILELSNSPDVMVSDLVELAKANEARDNVAALVVACETPRGTFPYAPRKPTGLRPRHKKVSKTPPARRRDQSSPEIIIVDENAFGEEGSSAAIHVVPADSSSPDLLSALQGFVGNNDGESRGEEVLCAACGNTVPAGQETCPHCGAW